MNETFETKELTLQDLLRVALKHMWVLFFAAILGAVLAFCYAKFGIVPKYETTTKYYVDVKSDYAEYTSGNSANDITVKGRLMSYSQLVMPSYVEILHTDSFSYRLATSLSTNEVNYPLEYTYTPNELYKMVTYSYDYSSATDITKPVFSITVTALSPEDAKCISQAISELCNEFVADHVSSYENNIVVIDPPKMNDRPVNNRKLLLMVIGAFMGFVLAYVLAFVWEMNDLRVHSEAELSEMFGLPVIGAVPENAALAAMEYRGKKKSTKEVKKA